MTNATSGDELIRMCQSLQFSLGRLLTAIGLFAVCMWLVRVARESPENGAAATAAIPLMLGSAIFSLLGRPGVGAIATVVAYGALGWLLIQLEDGSLANGRRRGAFERRRLPVVSADARIEDFINRMEHPE